MNTVQKVLLFSSVGLCFLIDNLNDAFLDPLGLNSLLALNEPSESALVANVVKEARLAGALEAQLQVPPEAYESIAQVLASVPDGESKLKNAFSTYFSSHTSAAKSPTPRKNLPKLDMQVRSERFPKHSVRIKKPNQLGVDKTKQYSGYLDIQDQDKHLFFWFFESRGDPKNDPTILWLNGGPGCSTMIGLFLELGPAKINASLVPVGNKHSWNNHANVIFLDQPVGTGFSHSSENVATTADAAKDTYAFLELFFQQFPEYLGSDFHIAGESYAGHFVPVFGHEFLSREDRSFNVSSLLIGNGLVDPLRQYDQYEPMGCGKGGHAPVIDPETCEKMRDDVGRCEMLIATCYSTQSPFTCVPATTYCNYAELMPYTETGRNIYDVRQMCDNTNSTNTLCYPEIDYIVDYLNQDDVKDALGAAEVDKFEACSSQVGSAFGLTGDWMYPTYEVIPDLLERGVPILVYAGDKDFICNWLGNERWSRELPWAHRDEFAAKELEYWKSRKTGANLGQRRNYENFTFLRVFGAGHMVPLDQPEAAAEFFERWIRGEYDLA